MARAKLSSILQSLEGRFGGGVFRNWKGLTVLSALTDSVANPNTASQVKFRELLAFASKAWKGLSAAQRGAWLNVAAYLTSQWEHFSNEAGTRQVIRVPRGPYTGVGALTATLGLLGSVDYWDTGDAVPSAPDGASGPTQPTALAASGDTDGIVLTWVAPADWGDLATTGKVRVWAMSEDGTFFSQLVTAVAAATLTYTITALRAAGSGTSIPLKAGWYFIQLDAVNDLGLRSAPSAVRELKIAAAV
jgi:hypothetical protein